MKNSDKNSNESHRSLFYLCNFCAIGLAIVLLVLTRFEILSWLGGGSWILGLVLYPFFVLGIVNVGRALFEQYVNDIEMLPKSNRWYWIYSIITILCGVALTSAIAMLI